MTLGITGGLGCGKSTVGRILERRGFRRIDSDELVRERVLTSPGVVVALRERYGDAVFEADGRVNRPWLGGRVFRDDSERLWLEGLTHPMVFSLWRQSLESDPEANWAVEVPLLFEKSLEKWFDFVVCVACAPAQQLARLQQRGLDSTLAELRISKQLPLARKIELSDCVLWNEGSPEFLEAQVDRLIGLLRR